MAFFVAFYSYKGGVGRTLALANTAYALAARGKRVVLLDMDLEAPDLQNYAPFALEGKGGKKGVVDFAVAYARTGKCPPIRSYVHRCRDAPGNGELWLMPAGSIGSAYQQQIGKLPWRRLHPKKGTGPFIDGLRQALIEHVNPHYVLIDSRTGLSDVGGLSTHRLADMVVLVFNLTRSCIDGSIRTYRSFVSNESNARFVQLVASPVPPFALGEGSLVESRLAEAGEKMPLGVAYGRSILLIEYNPALALSEELAVRMPERFPATAACYEKLGEMVQRANPDEVFSVLEQSQILRQKGQIEEALAALRRFVTSHSDDVEAHLVLANSLLETGRAVEAVDSFRRACTLQPDNELSHRRLGEALIAVGRGRDALEELTTAARLGDQSPELFLALSGAHASRREAAQEVQARRRAVLSTLSHEESAGPLDPLEKLATAFLTIMERQRPFPEFQAASFRDDVLRSLALSASEKSEVFRQVLEARISPQAFRLLARALREEAHRWPQLLGQTAADVQERIAREMIDPRDLHAMAAIGQEGLLDPVVNKILVLTAEQPLLPPEEYISEHLTTEDVFLSGIAGETGEYSIPPMANIRGSCSPSTEGLIDAEFWKRQGSR